MKQSHRFLCIVLALVLVAGLLPATAMAADTIIYFRNTGSWTSVYAYAWSSTDTAILGTWPGSTMTLVKDDVYCISVPSGTPNIIFNNGADTQTGDLTIPTDGNNFYDYSANKWSVYATYTVTAQSADEALGYVSGSGSYLHGSTVTLTAQSAPSFKFSGWQENGQIVSTANPYTFPAEGDRTLTALFEAFIGYTVTVTDCIGGSVTGAGEYEQNTPAVLTAVPDVGYVFSGWQENGEVVSTTNPYTFNVTQSRTLTPLFTPADTHSVTFNGTNVTLSGEAAATVGRDYIAVVRAAEGYVVPAAITVTIGGVETDAYSYQRTGGDCGELVIPAQSLTGSIVITAAGETVSGHLIINRLSNITTSSDVISVEDNTNYTTTLTAQRGYKLPDTITVTMGGEEVTISSGMLAYNAKTGSVTVRFITAEVVITAEAVETGPQASVTTADGKTVEYAWLSDALPTVQNTTGATITMLDDLYILSTLEITDAKDLTLDLNGKLLDCVKSCDALSITDSTVTVTDSAEEKTGTITCVSGTSAVVLSSGSLTINGGTFGDATGIELLAGTLTVNGGTIYGGSQGILIDGGAEAVINGGTIHGRTDANLGKGFNVKDGTLTINDGIIGNDKGSYMLYIQKAGTVYINGGTYKFRNSYGFYLNTASVLVLSGGTYSNGLWLNRNTVATYLDPDMRLLDENGQEISSASKAIAQYATIGKLSGSVSLIGVSLSMDEEVYYNLYFSTANLDAATEDMGLILWDEQPEDPTLSGGGTVLEGAVYDSENDRYMVRTAGIAAKNLGDTKYMVVYAKCADGTCAYSEVLPYSAKTYCLSRVENSTDENMKALCVAMMNYGAAAQQYFGYKTDDLMNAAFGDYQYLITAYRPDMMAQRAVVDEAKAGAFGITPTGFASRTASMSADGVFSINYYFTPATATDTVTFYYWTAQDYAAAQVLTAENASGSVAMTPMDNGCYWAAITDIAAKELDQDVFVCGVYEADGQTYSTGVIVYSLGYYCVNKAANGSEAFKPFAEATVVYSYYAKQYFA